MADIIFRIVVIFFEFPFGILGDYLGRKKSYLFGTFIMILTFSSMLFVYDYYLLLFCWGLWALGVALISGTDKAYIYELYRDVNEENDAAYIFGYFSAIQSLAFVMSHSTAGFFYGIHPNLPILLNMVFSIVATIIVITLPKPPSETLKPTFKQVLTTTKLMFSDIVLRNVVLAMSVLLMYYWTVTLIFQSLLLYLGFNVTYYGIVYALFTGLGIIGGLITGPMVKKIGKIKIILFGLLFTLGAMAFTGLIPDVWCIIGIMILGISYPLADSVLKAMLNESIENKRRASIMSLSNLISSLLLIFSRPLVGFFTDAWNVKVSFTIWFIIGIPIVISLMLLMYQVHMVRKTP